MPNKAYLEITNACNLACRFCHGTSRAIRFMTREEFTHAAGELRPFAEYLYFHLMGEPLLHPELAVFFEIAHTLGFKVILTTNGTLIKEKEALLLKVPALHKISFSLHAFEANELAVPLDTYLEDCFSFCEKAAEKGIISVMRLWNRHGEETLNGQILSHMHAFFDQNRHDTWQETFSGFKIRPRLYLEWGERFDWPDRKAPAGSSRHSCYGLRNQVGVLVDGRVVPCCLDAEGDITLGNLFETPLSEILASKRAVALKESFQQRRITEPLCLGCGFAQKF